MNKSPTIRGSGKNCNVVKLKYLAQILVNVIINMKIELRLFALRWGITSVKFKYICLTIFAINKCSTITFNVGIRNMTFISNCANHNTPQLLDLIFCSNSSTGFRDHYNYTYYIILRMPRNLQAINSVQTSKLSSLGCICPNEL